MGYFSELDHLLSQGKEYIRSRGVPNDREASPEEQEEIQLCLWYECGCPKKLTKEEEVAVLRDDMTSPHWTSGINKLLDSDDLPTPRGLGMSYIKRSN